MAELRIGCVVMAAGQGRRFGGGKLTADLEGRSLIRRTLEAVPRELFSAAAVVAGGGAVLELASSLGFLPVENERPELGLSRTVRLGLEALGDCQGALFWPGDQPLVRRETVLALTQRWRRDPETIAALGCRGVRGSPCIFPARLFPELLALTGDRGGSAVIRRHRDLLVLVEAEEEELWDVDTSEDLAALGEWVRRSDQERLPLEARKKEVCDEQERGKEPDPGGRL